MSDSDCDTENIPPTEINITAKLDSAKALMKPNTLDLLIDGWLSPRMRELLLGAAEITCDEISGESGHGEGFETLAFIPFDTVRLDTNGIFNKFYQGWGAVFYKIAECLRRGQVPTVQRIKDNFARNYNKNYEVFMERGGKIEYALDALVYKTPRINDDFDSDESYEVAAYALPSTPLDWQFEIARFMCINRGGGILPKLGPHRESYGRWRRRFLGGDSSYF